MVDFLVIRHNFKILKWLKMGYEYKISHKDYRDMGGEEGHQSV